MTKKIPLEMTYTEYLTILYRLGLWPCGKETSRFLGLSVRQLQRIFQRQAPISGPLQRLVSLYDEVLKDCPKIPNKWEYRPRAGQSRPPE